MKVLLNPSLKSMQRVRFYHNKISNCSLPSIKTQIYLRNPNKNLKHSKATIKMRPKQFRLNMMLSLKNQFNIVSSPKINQLYIPKKIHILDNNKEMNYYH